MPAEGKIIEKGKEFVKTAVPGTQYPGSRRMILDLQVRGFKMFNYFYYYYGYQSFNYIGESKLVIACII